MSNNKDKHMMLSNRRGGFRESGIEILRVLLAFMIVANHSIGHGIKVFVPELFQQHFESLLAIQVITNPAVNVFFLISGYFGIRCNTEKMLKLLSSLYIYAIGIAVFLFVVEGWSFSIFLKSIAMPWEYWWFATVYLILFLISNCINLVFKELDVKRLNKYILTLIAINFIQGFIFNGAYWGNGFSIAQAVTMYSIGYWINKTLANKRINLGYIFLIYVLLCVMAVVLTEYAETNEITTITKRVFSYNNPLVMAESVCLLLLFKNIKIKNLRIQGVIRFFAGGAFSTYLLTDHEGIRKYVFSMMINNAEKIGYPILMIVINALMWIIVASVIDYIRKQLTMRLTDAYVNKC